MEKENVRSQINIRVTPKEKEMIIKKAEERSTTITALILSSIRRNITVNLNTSDYRDLVIEVRRIGNNINQILRRINETGYYTKTQFELIKNYQEELEREINNQGRIIRKQKRSLEETRPRELINYLTRENKKIPEYLIYDEILDDINKKLLKISDLGKQEEVSSILLSTIDLFLERFIPTEYSYDELVNFSNDLSRVNNKIDRKILTGKEKFDKDYNFDKDAVVYVYNASDDEFKTITKIGRASCRERV